MLTAEIKVNGRLVSVVTIQNIGGDSGPELTGWADYRVGCSAVVPKGKWVYVKSWDRSRPAHELVRAAIEAIMRETTK